MHVRSVHACTVSTHARPCTRACSHKHSTQHSAPLRAVWLDEANSTGSELLKNVLLLQRDYNVRVTGAIFLVDRSRDRADLVCVRVRVRAYACVRACVCIPEDQR